MRYSHAFIYGGDKLLWDIVHTTDARICQSVRRWPEATHIISINSHYGKITRIRAYTVDKFRDKYEAKAYRHIGRQSNGSVQSHSP